MTKTYLQLQKQIAALTKEAEDLKRAETEGVVARIKEAIAAYGLTAADLGLAGGRRGRPAGKAVAAAAPRKAAAKGAAKAARKGAPVKVKYRDGNGNTWTGRGLQPRWLKAALAAGAKIDDFKI